MSMSSIKKFGSGRWDFAGLTLALRLSLPQPSGDKKNVIESLPFNSLYRLAKKNLYGVFIFEASAC